MKIDISNPDEWVKYKINMVGATIVYRRPKRKISSQFTITNGIILEYIGGDKHEALIYLISGNEPVNLFINHEKKRGYVMNGNLEKIICAKGSMNPLPNTWWFVDGVEE